MPLTSPSPDSAPTKTVCMAENYRSQATGLTSRAPTKTVCMARLLGWLVTSLLVAAALGWLAAQVSAVWSPLFIFPVLLGGLLGAMLVVLMRGCHVHSFLVVYSVAIMAVAVVVGSQHWLAYREAVLAVNEDAQRLQDVKARFGDLLQGHIPTPPTDLIAFMKEETRRTRKVSTWFGEVTLQGTTVWTFWGIDGLLVLLPTLLLLRLGRARAWCPTCRSWYRTTRTGRLDRVTTEALLALLEVPESDEEPDPAQGVKVARFASYLMSDCDGRCSKTELRLIVPSKSTCAAYPLDRDQCRAVEEIFDADRPC